MTRRGRLVLFSVGGLGLAVLLAPALVALASTTDFDRLIGTVYLQGGVESRRSYNVVSSVIFDYRGFDTMVEQLILFAAVTGVSLLLRRQKDEQEGPAREARAERQPPTPPGGLELAGTVLVGLSLLVAFYINLHPHITPGGGFQTGVLIASGILSMYLVDQFRTFERLAPDDHLEQIEGLAAAGYLAVGVVGLFLGGHLLDNVLPLGSLGGLYGGGTIWTLNMIVGVEVAAGFAVVYRDFLDQAFRIRERARR